MSTRAKKYLYIGVLVLMMAPVLQFVFQIPQGSLYGVTYHLPKDTFTIAKWFDGSWQEHTTAYIEENIGFRPFFVRLKNQIEYQFFNRTIEWIIIGKDKYVHDKGYVREYLGYHKIPFDEARQKIEKLKYVQDVLAKRGQHLIVVIAPSRANYFRQYIPDEYKIHTKGLSNYDQYLFLAKKYQINTVDFSSWFEQQRTTNPHPLYSKYGIHWSVYGATLASDSLLRYMQHHARRKWCDVTLDEPVATDSAHAIDVDLLQILNSYTIPVGPFYYAQTHVKQTGYFPKVLLVGDSHVWTLLESKMIRETFAQNSQYLFYNHDRYRIDSAVFEGLGTKEKTDVVPDLASYEFVVLVYSEAMLLDFGSGFIEATYDSLVNVK